MDAKDQRTEIEDAGRKSGIDIYENSEEHGDYVPDTDEEKKLVRKIDLFLLPTIFLMYLLSYMDRTK